MAAKILRINFVVATILFRHLGLRIIIPIHLELLNIIYKKETKLFVKPIRGTKEGS